ncbi:hypothetical protein AB1Y20_002249 [Prymnesium parvum]|uniref:Nucleotide-diphospho-sugar transferase domain-containing protein n=1 Tax=Prymnesium parvum TaxID=97485 RepID=A0AB34JAF0_PRYPA
MGAWSLACLAASCNGAIPDVRALSDSQLELLKMEVVSELLQRNRSASHITALAAATTEPDGWQPLHGKVAILGSDHRYCSSTNRTATATIEGSGAHGRTQSRVCGVAVDASAADDSFWWLTAALNNAWARAQGYDHLLYCITSCAHADSGEVRWTAWCKLVVMADALELKERYDSLLFMDSDAYWKHQRVNLAQGLILPFTEGTWTPHKFRSQLISSAESKFPSVYFGCNSPWDKCGTSWNFSAVNAQHGSANSGVILLRNTRHARVVLREWWHAKAGRALQHAWRRPGSCSDQAGLWRLWSGRGDLAAMMRVFRDVDIPPTSTSKGRKARCMRVVATTNNQKRSPIEHLTSFFPSYRRRKFKEAWTRGAAGHLASWCVTRISLNATAAAGRLLGHVKVNLPSRWCHNEFT